MYTWMKFTECYKYWCLMKDTLHLGDFSEWLAQQKRSSDFPGLYGIKNAPLAIRRAVDRQRRKEKKEKI